MSQETKGRGADSSEEPKKRKAVEMATSIGEAVTSPDWPWQELVRFDLREYISLLVQSGPGLLDSLELQIANLQKLVTEQATAINLREAFGVPKIELALPVFAQLASMESEARLALREGAQAASLVIERIKAELERNLAIFFAAQLNQLEEEEAAHRSALEKVQVETAGKPGLEGVHALSETKLRAKIADLRAKKSALAGELLTIARRIGGKIQGAFETTVFQAKQQTLEVVTIS